MVKSGLLSHLKLHIILHNEVYFQIMDTGINSSGYN